MATVGFVMPVSPSVRLSARDNTAATGLMVIKFLYLSFFIQSVEKSQISLKPDKNSGTVHADLCTCMVMFHHILFRMRIFSDKSCIENQNTHIMFNNILFLNHAIYEIMWKNMVQPGRTRITT